ncbi:aspartate, glycine, lysine and serine-rich protein-like [Schistocerca serialis cubense]|uniref:aspartate, glycine, lysine and serine-rich protein-like n=1 Tax=Schistocerca serialis cubense TaxID=2023355 RepID=UPI00214ED7DF|nr:aspartate, glycine, lysine and serine-rich protein-like [Schistocerca serialis cubense]
MANYLRALRKDVLRLESARKAMRAALGVQPAEVLARAAQSAPTLPQSRGLSSSHQSPAGLRSSSSESEGEQGTDSRVSQWRQRRKGRNSSSVLEFRRQRSPDEATEGGSKRKESSDSSGAGDIEETGQSGSGGDSEREAQESSGNGAGGFDDGDAGAFGGIGAGDGQPCGSGGTGAGDVGRTCSSGGTGVDKDAYPPSGNDNSNDVHIVIIANPAVNCLSA